MIGSSRDEPAPKAPDVDGAAPRILLVDADGADSARLGDCVQDLGYAVCGVASYERAVQAADDAGADLALIELRRAGSREALETAAQIGNRLDLPIVYLIDEAGGDLPKRAAASNPFGSVLRPFAPGQLRMTIDTALQRHARERELRATEAALRRTVDDLQQHVSLMTTIFDSMSEGVVAFDAEHTLLFRNASALWLGDDDDQIDDADHADQRKLDIAGWTAQHHVFHADAVTPLRLEENPVAQILSGAGETPDPIDLFVRLKGRQDGVYLSVEVRLLAGPEKPGAVIVFRDITRLRKAEAEVQEMLTRQRRQTQLMETIFSSISDGVVVADHDGVLTMFNPSAEQIVGIGMTEVDPERWAEEYGIYFPDETTLVPTAELPLVRAIRGESTDDVELFIRNGKRPAGVHISVSGRPLPATEQAFGGVIVLRDISRQKKAAAELANTMEELRYQNELIDTAFRSISDGIVVANAEGEFLYVNPAAEQIVGMGITDGPQENWAETYGSYYPDRRTPIKTDDLPLVRAIRNAESIDEEDMFIRNRNRPNGVYIRVSARPLLNDVGGIRGGVIVFRDVTERVLAEEALGIAFAEGRLEMADTILHNIGNAITSVITGIETVRRDLLNDHLGRRLNAISAALAERGRDWLEYLQHDEQGRKVVPYLIEIAQRYAASRVALVKSVERARDRAHRIADIVRTQKTTNSAGRDRKDINLHDTIAGALRVLSDSIAKRRILTTIDCARARREIRIRESQFHQMLVNLVKNAIEAIDERAAQERVARRPRIRITAFEDGAFLTLDINDTGIGIGIGIEDSKVLFAPGYTTKPHGSGLGLHSAANFVIACGGTIQPLRGRGKGTTMRIRLPLASVLSTADRIAHSTDEGANSGGQPA